MKARRLSGVGLILVMSVGFLLRLVPLGRYVTPDEPMWVYRSIRFLDATAAGEWSAIPSTGHPGITTMWLGAAGVMARRRVVPQDSERHLEWIRCLAWLAPENAEAFGHLAPFLPWGRAAVVVVTTLGLVALFPLVARLFDRRMAGLVVGLLALDPFLIGHSGLLHTDALLSSFSMLTLVTALIALQEPERLMWWVASGALAALAVLTKTPAVILLPFVLTLAGIRGLRPGIGRVEPRASCVSSLLVGGALFIASFLVVSLALFPALWANPLATLDGLFSFVGRHVQTVQRPIFFAGEMRYDPGPLFYLTALVFRMSPVVLVGLVGGLVSWRRIAPQRRFAFLILLVFVVLFGAGMSLGAKKHDRYLLPVFPPLTLAGVLGMSAFLSRYGAGTAGGIDLSAIVLQSSLALLFAACPLGYANPLLGGPAVASKLLSMDWGESVGAAARRLNRLPEAGQLTVATENVPSFASLFCGRTLSLDDDPEAMYLADYIVTQSSQKPFGEWGVFDSLHSTDHRTTMVYINQTPSLVAAYLSNHVGEDELILLDADMPLLRRYEGPGTLLSGAGLADAAAVSDWLAERVPEHETVWLVSSPGASPITSSLLRRQLVAVASPRSSVNVSSVVITPFVPQMAPGVADPPPYSASFDGRLALVETAVPRSVTWPGVISFVLRWRAQTGLLTDYRAVAVLRDEEGHGWGTTDRLVWNEDEIPTSCWQARTWSDVSYQLRLPPGIPPGAYTVEISLYDEATGARLGAAGPEGAFRGTRVPVGEITVERPTEPVDIAALAMDQRLEVSLGPLTLLGMNPPRASVESGDYVSFALFWQADVVPQADYDVRLQWVSSGGRIEQEVTRPVSLHPSSQWRSGDRFRSPHRLHVPPDLPGGTYRLRLSVADLPEGGEIEWVCLGTIEVLPRERVFTLPEAMPYELDVTFGGQIQSCGYDLGDVELTTGETVPLTLCWRASGPVGETREGLTLFVHLLGPDGLPHGQVDRIPGGGKAPTNTWAPGQVIVDEIALIVDEDAPPGVYRIALGFYDVAYGSRLPVTDGTGASQRAGRAILPVEIMVSGDES